MVTISAYTRETKLGVKTESMSRSIIVIGYLAKFLKEGSQASFLSNEERPTLVKKHR